MNLTQKMEARSKLKNGYGIPFALLGKIFTKTNVWLGFAKTKLNFITKLGFFIILTGISVQL